MSWSEDQAFTPRRLFDRFLPSRPARDRRAAHYSAGRLTAVTAASAKRRGAIWRKLPSYLQRPYFEKMCRIFS
jgi:hypothetical protein